MRDKKEEPKQFCRTIIQREKAIYKPETTRKQTFNPLCASIKSEVDNENETIQCSSMTWEQDAQTQEEIIGNIHIDRPAGTAHGPGGGNNNHVAAFQIFIDELERKLIYMTFEDALGALVEIINELEHLPGYQANGAYAVALNNLRHDVETSIIQDNNASAAGKVGIILNYCERYLLLRNAMPYTFWQDDGGRAMGNGNGEAQAHRRVLEGVDELEAGNLGNNQENVKETVYQALILLDTNAEQHRNAHAQDWPYVAQYLASIHNAYGINLLTYLRDDNNLADFFRYAGGSGRNNRGIIQDRANYIVNVFNAAHHIQGQGPN